MSQTPETTTATSTATYVTCPSCDKPMCMQDVKPNYAGQCTHCKARFVIDDVEYSMTVWIRPVGTRRSKGAGTRAPVVRTAVAQALSQVRSEADAARLTETWTWSHNVHVGDAQRVVPNGYAHPPPGDGWCLIKHLRQETGLSSRVLVHLHAEGAITACFDLRHKGGGPFRAWYRIIDPLRVQTERQAVNAKGREPAERRGKAWLLRYVHGMTYVQIAAQLGGSGNRARSWVRQINSEIYHQASKPPPWNAPGWWKRLQQAGAIGTGNDHGYGWDWEPLVPEDYEK